METALFEETQEFPLRGVLAFASGAAFFVIPMFYSMPLLLVLLMFLIGIGISTLLGATLKTYTRVTQTEFSFGPNIFTRRIPAGELTVVGPRSIPFLAGTGIHRYRGKWYYNMRRGEGLEIHHGKTKYVVGTARMDELQTALRDLARINSK
ncbi:MAG: hypothetical protein KDB65_06010 [Calditrichaeota bacterium]|nr:hypothetical protein [Calditrichota bacterium]MCB9367773.1 hypothetical protein [Calditrichota bacterium]